MVAAKVIFLSHMRAYSDALNHESIVGREPAEVRENARARTMRNGLAVIGFSILEDFLRRRAKEILGYIGQAGVEFGQLPDALRRILTVRAPNAAVFQLRLSKADRDEIVFAQEIARQVASTSDSPFHACEVSFGYDGANLTEAAVDDFLKAPNVEKPWESIGHVAARAGVGTLRLGARVAFGDIARRRHASAHDPQADVQPSDLKAGYLNAFGLALGFDAIASVAALRFRLLNRGAIGGDAPVRHIRIYFVDQREDKRFGVRRESAKRYYKCFDELQQAQALSREVCLRTRDVCVIRSIQQIPTDWELVAL